MGSPARLRKTRSLTFSGRGEGAFRIEVKSAMEVLRVALYSTIDPVHPIHASRASRPYPTPAPWLPAANFVAETRGAFKGFELSPDRRARCTFGRSSRCSHRTVSSVTQSVLHLPSSPVPPIAPLRRFSKRTWLQTSFSLVSSMSAVGDNPPQVCLRSTCIPARTVELLPPPRFDVRGLN